MNAKLWLGLAAIAAVAAGIFLSEDGDRVGTAQATSGSASRDADGGDSAAAFPSRILPASAAAVDWLVGLEVDPGRVIALPVQADRYASTRLEPERWAETKRYKELASEVALGFQPDLVLVSPITSAGAVAKIEKSGVRVLTVEESATWSGLEASARSVAAALGLDDRSEALIAQMNQRRAALQGRDHAQLVVLPYANYGGGGSTSGKNTTLDLVIELAGFENAGATAGRVGYANLSHEEILVLEFDAILVMGTGFDASDSAAQLASAKTLDGVGPVRDRRFIYVPEALYASGSQTILDAAEEVARQGDALAPDAKKPDAK